MTPYVSLWIWVATRLHRLQPFILTTISCLWSLSYQRRRVPSLSCRRLRFTSYSTDTTLFTRGSKMHQKQTDGARVPRKNLKWKRISLLRDALRHNNYQQQARPSARILRSHLTLMAHSSQSSPNTLLGALSNAHNLIYPPRPRPPR